MTVSPQPIDNTTISAFGAQVPKSVVFAIHDASQKSGVDFSYLVKQAGVESSFDPNAKARGSSATGLYQFIQSTWLNMVERHGDKYGIDTDGMSRKEILALRKDPELSSYMAAELANENREVLENNWGGEVGETELYLAHFMGSGGASSFLRAHDRNPMMAAADLFPEAARSNRAVFFDGHRARSVSGSV
ncbi:MAG: lytic transglycosylase domain-containing protein [Alphaproteobacteria bacterium]|nr:lytic transglycosylase domain-containing protein [Alphaproteobacteria bacterium]